MKNVLSLLLMVLFLASCKKHEPGADRTLETEFADKNWDRIRIPDGGQVQAVAGNVEDTLLVTTLYNTYIITNGGTKFTLTSTNLNNTPGLYVSRDTVYALQGLSYDEKSKRHYASMPSYYTTDKGLSWHSSFSRMPLVMPIGIVTTKITSHMS
jgi:hypothetical protein